MAIIDVNLQAVPPETGPSLLPPGEYRCAVSSSLLIRSRTGRPLLKFVYDVLDGPHQGARLVDAMLLDHEAGLSRLKILAMRTGHPSPERLRDTEELHGLDFMAKVCVEHDETGNHPPRNLVKAYRAAPRPAGRA